MSAKGLDTQGLDKILERGLALTHQYVNKEMGAANGIAPLDAYGRVPLSHLPASQQGELFVYFDRMETSITAIQAGSSESSESEGYKVIYSTSQKQFFLVEDDGIHTGGAATALQGYPLWLESDMVKFGTVGPGSVIPYTGKVYVCRKDNSTWVWDGSKLASFDFGSEAIASLSSRIEEVNDDLTDEINADRGQFGKEKGYTTSLNYPSIAGYVNSGVIPLNRDEDIVYYNALPTGMVAVTFFDKDLKYLPSVRGVDSLAERTIAKADFPERAVYFAVTSRESTKNVAWYRNGKTLEGRLDAVSQAILSHKGERGQFNCEGAYTTSNKPGNWTDTPYRNSGIIPLNRNADIEIYTECGIGMAAVAFFDKDFRYLDSPRGLAGGLKNMTVAKADFPAGAEYFAVSTRDNSGLAQAWWKNGESLEGRLDAISRAILESSGAVPEFPVKDKYINASTGVLGNTAGYQTTGLIAIDRTADIAMTGRGTTSVAGIALYDAAGAFISAKPFTSSNTQMTLTVPAAEIPEAAAYFAATCKEKDGSTGSTIYYGTWSNGRASLVPLADTAKAAEMSVFIKLWNKMCSDYGSYNPREAPDDEHPFVCNHVWLTYSEAQEVYSNGVTRFPFASNIGKQCRTNILATQPIPFQNPYWRANLGTLCTFASNIETVRVSADNVTVQVADSGFYATFYNATKLKTVLGVIKLYANVQPGANTFVNCSSLESISIQGIAVSLSFAASSKLSLASLQYLVDNSAVPAGSNATVTLHADVYAKLTDALIASAAAKRITFTAASQE